MTENCLLFLINHDEQDVYDCERNGQGLGFGSTPVQSSSQLFLE
jgi:hypothetical protein